MHTVTIRTAQNVDIEYNVATLGDRIFAAFLDYMILFIYTVAVIATYIYKVNVLNPFMVYYFLLLLVPVAFYDFLCELFFGGQSFGKMAMSIKVVKLDGSQPTVASYLLRWVLRFVDITLFSGMIAVIVILINGKGQRIGDIAAGTTVISLKQKADLRDTIYMKVDETHQPMYTNAKMLSEEVVRLLREALDFVSENIQSDASREVLAKAASLAAVKLKVPVPEDHYEFLVNVLKDYNYLHRKA